MEKESRWKVFLVSFIIVIVVAFIGSIFISPSVNSNWYLSHKPSITPPNYIFPIAWSILFLLIALSLSFAWLKADNQAKKKIAIIFGINFALNILWSIFFFGLQNPTLAFIDLILLWISILLMIFTVCKIYRPSSYMLIPYLLWVSFAGALNYLFMSRNF